jgi:hypothetical protein
MPTPQPDPDMRWACAGRLVALANLTAVHVVPLRGKFGMV